MGIIRVRLSPSGAPLGGNVVTAQDGVAIQRVMTAAYNTVLYTCPTGALGRIEGPVGENPAQVQHVIPSVLGAAATNRWRVFSRLTLHARARTPAGAPPQALTLTGRLQVNVAAPAVWQTPLFIFGDAASGNGLLEHTFANANETEQTAAVELRSDHIFDAAAGSTIDVRAVWLQSGTYDEVVSSYANEGIANGGWLLESFLALETLL